VKQSVKITGAVVMLSTLAACAAGSPESQHAAAGGELPQLMLGLWHGVIAPVTLIVEIINRLAPNALSWAPHFYEPKGTGVIYDIGFYFGLGFSPALIWAAWNRRR
jgi:hypothetical protein